MGERRRLQDGRGEASASSVVRAVSHSFGEGTGNWRRGPSAHARRDCCCSRTATALECNPPGPSHGGGWVLSGPVWCLVKGSAPGREEREEREREREREERETETKERQRRKRDREKRDRETERIRIVCTVCQYILEYTRSYNITLTDSVRVSFIRFSMQRLLFTCSLIHLFTQCSHLS